MTAFAVDHFGRILLSFNLSLYLSPLDLAYRTLAPWLAGRLSGRSVPNDVSASLSTFLHTVRLSIFKQLRQPKRLKRRLAN